MSNNVNLPILPDYVKARVSAIYEAKTAEEFDTAFDLFIARMVTIRVNGQHMSREEYKQLIRGEIQNDTGATIVFNNIVSVDSDSNDESALGTGTVGVSFKAVVFGGLSVFGLRQSSTVNSSLNVTVIHDTTVAHPDIGDSRRVSVFDEVITDTPNAVAIPGNVPPGTTA